MWEWSKNKIQFIVKRNPRKREGGDINTRSMGQSEVSWSQDIGISKNMFVFPGPRIVGAGRLQCFRGFPPSCK